MQPPAFFESIRQRADALWTKLDADEELAGPWRQLFRQVQSPRHVLSELLQNADDAGASRARAGLDDGFFVFEHDGHDFTEDQFESLCRFGFSNKRNLHTIGFRGIGFKSTFSLGDMVEVATPTLSVRFRRTHFTRPEWLPPAAAVGDLTRIRIAVSDDNLLRELRKNFDEWVQSPSSLLFFNNLRELEVQGRTIRKRSIGNGPVPDSFRVALSDAPGESLLLLRSGPEAFPAEVRAEIREERNADKDLDLPPCHVEIVLGLRGAQRLFVVLPTGATVTVPFSCNAPFLQDPARYAIKDPATSPTNRWLLRRAGRLAGETLFAWLSDTTLNHTERAAAYDLLLGPVSPTETALAKSCAEAIGEGFIQATRDKPLLLTTAGELAETGTCLAVPPRLHEVWDAEQLLDTFGPDLCHVLAAEVSPTTVEILHAQEWVDRKDSGDVLDRLTEAPPPHRPATWKGLQALWHWVQRSASTDIFFTDERRRQLGLVPVEGRVGLHPARDVIRLSTRRDLLSAEDWEFLTGHALAVTADWIAWLAQAVADKRAGVAGSGEATAASQLLQNLGLHEPTPVDRVAAKASERLFSTGKPIVKDCVRAAQIFAALGARAPDGFKVFTLDYQLRDLRENLVADETGELDSLVPPVWCETHLLAQEYTDNWMSCKPEQWSAWVQSEGSRLHVFAPLCPQKRDLYHRADVERIVTERGATKPKEYHYKRDTFTLRDFGFDPALMAHWHGLAARNHVVWHRVLEVVLKTPVHHWNTKVKAEVQHVGNSYIKPLDCGNIPAAWIVQFRALPCLPDVHERLRTPAELLLRTPETEPLMGIEAFVRADLDTPATRPLLKLLGVRDTPADAGKILDRLRALAKIRSVAPFLGEVLRFYEALDRVVARITPAALRSLQEVFASEAIVLTDTLGWATTGEVTIFADAELGAPSLHAAAQRLAMWPRLGVSERPAVEKTLAWLASLPVGGKLDANVQRRVRLAIQRDPHRVWQGVGHWLSLEPTWEPVGRLRFRLTLQKLAKYADLSPAIRRATADLRWVNPETTQLHPFAELPDLADAVSYRVTRCVRTAGGNGKLPAWLGELAGRLCRIQFGNEEDTKRVREIAGRLWRTEWLRFSQLEVTPYIEGAPVGEPARPLVLWQDRQLYVASGRPAARLHRELCDEIGRPFAKPEVADAVAACFDREPAFVQEYLDEQFRFDTDAPLPGLSEEREPQAAPPAPPLPVTPPTPVIPPAENPVTELVAETLEAGPVAPLSPEEALPEPVPLPPKPKIPPEPTLIERYAAAHGFRWDPRAQRQVHPSGRWLGRDDSQFHWVERMADGTPVLQLWLTDQRLPRGVEIAAELWLALKQNPDSTAIVALNGDHSLCRLTGAECLDFQKIGELELYPARYRLVASS